MAAVLRSPAELPRTPSPSSLPALSTSSSFSSASDAGHAHTPMLSPRIHLNTARLSLRDSPYPSPFPSPSRVPRGPVLRPLASPMDKGEVSPAALLTVEAFTGDGFPWKGGGGVREEGPKSPLSPCMVETVEHATSPAHAPTPASATAPQRAVHSWSHHEHLASPSYSPAFSPSSPPAFAHAHVDSSSSSHRPHTPSPYPTPNLSHLSRHHKLKLARQTISVQTTVAPPPASYFDIDPELTALAAREVKRESALSASGMVNGGRCGGRSRAPRGLKPLTAIQRNGNVAQCPLRSILGAPTPPLRG